MSDDEPQPYQKLLNEAAETIDGLGMAIVFLCWVVGILFAGGAIGAGVEHLLLAAGTPPAAATHSGRGTAYLSWLLLTVLVLWLRSLRRNRRR